MKQLINFISISILLFAAAGFAEQSGHSGGQSNIIMDTHKGQNLSSGTGARKNSSEAEIRQSNVLKVIQKEHDVLYEKGPEGDQETALSVAVPPVKDNQKSPLRGKPGVSRGEMHKRMLADAWNKYEDSRYQAAADLFSKVVDQTRDRMVKLKAYHGLAYSMKQLGNTTEAQEILEVLVKQDFRLQETTPALMELLELSHDWLKAEHYLNKMPEDQMSMWSQRIDEGRFEDEYTTVRQENDAVKLPAFVKKYRYVLAECRQTGVFIEAAGLMAGNGGREEAGKIYKDLLQCGQEDWKFRLQVHHEMEKNLPVNEALASVEKEIAQRPGEKEYADLLSALRMRLLMKKFLGAESKSPDYFETGNKILDIDSEKQDVRSALAWTCFNEKDYQCALRHFEILSTDNPENRDYAKGVIYSLIHTGREDDALVMLENYADGLDEEMSAFRHDLYSMNGGRYYKENNFGRAEYFLLKALEIKPEDRNDRTLLAWTYYRQQKYNLAVNLFEDLYRTEKSPESANNLMLAFEKLPPDEQTDILSKTEGEQEGILLKSAADRNYDNNAPMTAAYIYGGEGTCYKNCNSPVIELSGYYRNKSGDKGLSRLSEFSFPLRFHYPVRAGKEWVFSVTPIYLNSGDASSDVYAGHYFRYLDDSSAGQRPLTHSVTAYEPEIRYRTEGLVQREFMIGTTPINGPVGPMPRLTARIEKKDQWFIQLHQDSVRESILSYTGLKDPYGEEKWGRVLKTGAGAGMTITLPSPYWVSFDAGYDYYWGQKVVENYSLSGTISTGRTDSVLNGEANSGMFLTARHFDRNSAFYTFGHGGYFSPDVFIIAGPFFRYKTKACRDFWFDGEVSAGYMYFRTEDAPHYYKVDDRAVLLNSAAQSDLSGDYEGERESTVGINVKLKAMKLIQDNIGIGAYLQGNNSADFNEFSIGMVVQYYINPLKQVSHVWDLFQTME